MATNMMNTEPSKKAKRHYAKSGLISLKHKAMVRGIR